MMRQCPACDVFVIAIDRSRDTVAAPHNPNSRLFVYAPDAAALDTLLAPWPRLSKRNAVNHMNSVAESMIEFFLPGGTMALIIHLCDQMGPPP